MMQSAAALDAPEVLDANDPLKDFRDQFHLPQDDLGRPLLYLCGHSLGLQPKGAAASVNEALAIWQRHGVDGHFTGAHPWVSYHERLAQPLGNLVGALPREVVAMNSLSVNLHLLLASFYRPTSTRHKILIEADAFPSDRYAIASQIKWHGFDPGTSLIEAAPRAGESLLRHEDVCDLIERHGSEIAVVLLPGVQFRTGQRLDLTALARVARRHGCIVGADLAHAIGNVPLALHDSDVDFAVWCSYKYLNAGPGAIGGAFVHDRHARAFDLPRLAGWWGHDKASRFAMPNEFVPLAGAEGWQVSNPPILAMAPLVASLELFARAGMTALSAKSQRLTSFLADSIARELDGRVAIVTPSAADSRGAQLSLTLIRGLNAQRVRDKLRASRLVCDFREPNVLRLAPVPFYNTYNETAQVVGLLKDIVLAETQ